MKLRNPFGKADKEKRPSPPQMSPLLKAMAAELPRWPPQKRRILEKILIKASAAGVSSMDEFSAFLDDHPDLRAGFSMTMLGAPGPGGNEMAFPTEPEAELATRVNIPGLGMNNLNVSSADEMGAFFAENPENSIKLNSHILETARTSCDRLAEAVALGELGLAYARLGQLPKAIYYFEHHLQIARELGNWQWEMEDCRNLGRANLELGENERARAVFEDALLRARRQGDRQWIINHSYSLASVYAALGDLQGAAELTNNANSLSNQVGR